MFIKTILQFFANLVGDEAKESPPLSDYIYHYKAQAMCIDGTIRVVEGVAIIECAGSEDKVLYRLKEYIAQKHFHRRDGVVANDVLFLERTLISETPQQLSA